MSHRIKQRRAVADHTAYSAPRSLHGRYTSRRTVDPGGTVHTALV